MSFFLLMYFFIIFSLFYCSYLIFKKYNNYLFWKYLVFSFIIFSLWVILYLLAYTTTQDESVILYLSRILYFLSLTGNYWFIFFIFFYNNTKISNLFLLIHKFIKLLFFLLFWVSVFTPYIIKWMIYDSTLGYYYEDFGFLFIIYKILYLLSPFLLLFLWINKLKILKWLNKLRFTYLYIWISLFNFLFILILVLFPLFWIWILQKEQILFFIPLVWLVYYSINKYFHVDFKTWFGKLIVFILSLFFSFVTLYFFRLYYLQLWLIYNSFWGFSINIWFFDILLWIILFIVFNKYLTIFLIWNILIYSFEKELSKLKKEIPYISNFPDLNSFLKLKCYQLCKIKYSELVIIDNEENYYELIKFFNKNSINDIFINDMVFIEENKNKFDKNQIIDEINPDSYLIFPLYNNKNKLIGFFNLWQKPFGDTFNSDEIKVIKDFIEFISWHLKYLRIYDRINDLNINLDKRIDEKTMQYNALINKQKDFISLISHEIKWPIWSSVFQVDSLLDDIEDWKYDEKHLKNELWLLIEQLLKIWNLTNKLFSIEKYDIWKIELLKEKININTLILNELKIIRKKNNKVKFNFYLNEDIWFIELDKVQIIQVIDNLINNAIKFSSDSSKYPEIIITTKSDEKNITIEIEDNWNEFEYTNISSLFEKYTTWKWSSIWLGMWLYLCKKIISLHKWEISAIHSDKLGWAKFIIKLPK